MSTENERVASIYRIHGSFYKLKKPYSKSTAQQKYKAMKTKTIVNIHKITLIRQIILPHQDQHRHLNDLGISLIHPNWHQQQILLALAML